MNTVFRTSATRRRVILALVGALALPAALPLGTATASHFSDTEELTAEDAVGSAIAFSVSTFPEGAEEVVLGRDDAFADSLASGMLQATRPLLLTASATLSEPTKAELARLAAKTVHVLGGESAIAPAVVTALEAEGYTVQRHSGPTRIDTAVEVAKKLAPEATKAILARAFGTAEDETRAFADSLAAGGWAAATAMPVLLTETEKLSEATAAYLKTSAIKEVFVVGGAGAVNEVVVTQLAALGMTVKRVSGPTRFHTALAIAGERGFTTAADADKVIVTEGQAADAWAPGFAAAARSKKDNAPIVLAVGSELPEPTSQWLSGGEGSPEPEPTEEPTGEPTPDPSASPTPDPSASPTPDPSEPPAEPTDAKAALLCAPMLATEACDAAATALGQVAGAGPQLVTFEVPAVARYDHAIGKVAAPETVNGLTVTGCGYTNEPVFIENDGTIYLMLAGDPGTCSAEFAVETSAGTRKQTVEFNVGEDYAPPSSMVIPELVAARPVKQDDEGVHVRFVFDEPIAPAPNIDASKFHMFNTDGTPNVDSAANRPSSVMLDPRNPSAVIAVFASALYERSTVVSVRGGLVCAPANPSICDTAVGGGPAGTAATSTDEVAPGAVRDIDRFPNPTGHFGLRTLDLTDAASQNPDLLRVDQYQAGDQSLLFTFSEPVNVPVNTPVGAATVLLKDGTVKRSDANGWRAGPTSDSLRVTFAGDGLSAANMEQARRGFVAIGVVTAKDNGQANTPTTAIIAGGGISDLPDFVDVENVQHSDTTPSSRSVTYVFEEPLDEVDVTLGTLSKFVAIKNDGTVVYPPGISGTCSGTGAAATCPRNVPEIQADRRKVKVSFADWGSPTGQSARDYCARNPGDCPSEKLNAPPLYHTVLTGAVKAFSSQKRNFADTIRVSTPVIHGPGGTKAPDLTAVSVRVTQATCGSAAESVKSTVRVAYTFDLGTITIDTGTSPALHFDVWYTDADKPRVTRVSATYTTATTPNSSPAFKANGKDAESVYETTTHGPPCTSPPQASTAPPAGWINAKYLAVEAGKVKLGSFHNYPAGMKVPS